MSFYSIKYTENNDGFSFPMTSIFAKPKISLKRNQIENEIWVVDFYNEIFKILCVALHLRLSGHDGIKVSLHQENFLI